MRIVRALLGVLLVVGVAPAAMACGGCAEAIAAQAKGGDPGLGYNLSIFLMIGFPFVVLAGFAGYFWHISRAAVTGLPVTSGRTTD